MEKYQLRTNTKCEKIIKSTSGTFKLETPIDRAGSFEPQIVKKNQTTISNEIEERILSMYGLGLRYNKTYWRNLSNRIINCNNKCYHRLKWKLGRPLEAIYPFVWLDAIHYRIKDGGKYITKAVYTVLGMGIDGKKDILGLYLSQSEGANFWLLVLIDLNNRGLEDILIASVDGLKGFREAIKTIFLQTEVQLCVVHPCACTLCEK